MVLPGLTRASSSFTITSNHQNILPLWPAAPPPGQPVVFFYPLPAGPVGTACADPAVWRRPGRAGRPVGPGIMPVLASWQEGAAPSCGPGFPVGAVSPAGPAERRRVDACPRHWTSGRQGPGSQCPPLPVRVSSLSRMFRHLPAVMVSRHKGLSGRSRPPPSSFIRDAGYAPRLLRSRAPGHGGPHRPRRSAGIKKDVHRHGDRRTSCFTDAARGIRTACRAGKRWPRNRRPARRHCSTGHGNGSWPGSCARRTWA